MAKIYAHSQKDSQNIEDWQELEIHLANVADKARMFANGFSSGEWGYVAGLWHDLGKFQKEFQDKLKGAEISVEHSGVGAGLAFQKNEELGLPLAFTIAGHHAGLANFAESGQGLPSPLKERLGNFRQGTMRELLADIPEYLRERMIPELPDFLTALQTDSPQKRRRQARSCEFWIRFLFSALVDADWLDTEAFLNPAEAKMRGGFATITSLRERLDSLIEDIVASLSNADRNSPVNRARSYVLDSCHRAVDRSAGVFRLTVPTGGGKTLAAMSFALRHAEKYGLERVIVVIPYTSIIEQNAEVYRKAVGRDNVIEHHSNLDIIALKDARGLEATKRQELASENWDAPVIVTTNVQFFESLFANRKSRCRKLHNIARSVIILDEVQSLPPAFLLSILDALNELTSRYGCSVVLSTATPPALAAREGFSQGLQGIRDIIDDPGRLAVELKRVDYQWPDLEQEPVEWNELAAELAQYERVLTVVHKRRDARSLAQKLQELLPAEQVFHLSALMCPAHRADVLKRVKETLDRDEICHLISTQLIEAGVDIDFPVVYRALGGLDSIVQAAGRCNREGKLDTGIVKVFRAPTQPPPGTPGRALRVAESLLRENGGELDPNDPELFEKFFRMIYMSEDQDTKHIQTHRQKFNFATVGKEFRLIEDGFTHAIVVPYEDAEERLREVDLQGPNRETLRGLQPYLVNVYPKSFNDLFQRGAIVEVVEGIYALSSLYGTHYNEVFGLMDGDEPQVDPENLIVSGG